MKVQILGTGAIYSKRNCASLIIDKKILFDIGPGTIKQLLKENYDLKEINAILISHLHSDHILDFPIFIVNLEVLNINHKVTVIGPVNMKEKLLKLLELMYGNYFDNFINKNFEFIEVKENNYDILYNNYKINLKNKTKFILRKIPKKGRLPHTPKLSQKFNYSILAF